MRELGDAAPVVPGLSTGVISLARREDEFGAVAPEAAFNITSDSFDCTRRLLKPGSAGSKAHGEVRENRDERPPT